MISDYKSAARQTLSGNWLKLAIIILVIGVCGSGITEVVTNFIIDLTDSFILSNAVAFICGCVLEIFSFGYLKSILLLSETGSFEINDLFSGIEQALDIIVFSIILSFATLVGTILLIIPGIYISLRYSLTYYIMADNPEIGWQSAAKTSAEMMKGRYWDLFLMNLSFIGWAFLSVLTLGIGFFFLIPYIQASISHFYIDTRNTYYPSIPNDQYSGNQF